MSNSFVTPWTVAHQAPMSMGFPKQECWSGLPFPSPGDLPAKDPDQNCISCIGRWILYHQATREAPTYIKSPLNLCPSFVKLHHTPQFSCVIGVGLSFSGLFSSLSRAVILSALFITMSPTPGSVLM